MNAIVTILSMLHEGPDIHSATRLFRGRPVLGWTLERLRQCRNRAELLVLCWDDQLQAAEAVAQEAAAQVITRGARHAVPPLDVISASRKWSDGWRGGPFGTCAFDAGFFAPFIEEIVHDWAAPAAILVDPASALVDPELIDELVVHAKQREAAEIVFTQAAPGLAGVLLRSTLIERLAQAQLHAGRLLHYMPDQPIPDPIAGHGCCNVPTRVARTRASFLVNSDRQIERLGQATEDLNGQLIDTEAEELVRRMESLSQPDALPREVVLELTARRISRPIFSPLSQHTVERADFTLDQAEKLFAELGRCDDLRLTLAGIGDPLLHPQAIEIIRLARARGVHAIHVETDLLELDSARLGQLAEAGIDIVSIHLPALSQPTYEAVMGVPRFVEAINNLTALIAARQQGGSALPLLVPIFTKCQVNFAEMEAWYDNWLRMLGSAVIAGPSDFAGQLVQVGVADMTPTVRRPCQRLEQRLMILSDGRIVSCENDFQGRQCLGRIDESSVAEIWAGAFGDLRNTHRQGVFPQHPLCRACTDWHRP